MLFRFAIVLLPTLGGLETQISHPKEKASDYPAHAQAPNLELAAEYLVHSLPGPNGAIFVHDYLVIEVAAYPLSKAGAEWSTGEFTLRINKKGTVLLPQSPGMVAASIKYPDWEQHPTPTASAGIGDKQVIFGPLPPAARFPGDPGPVANRLPAPPRAPEPASPNGEGRPLELSIEQICQQMALWDGPFRNPVNGYLFFPHAGKLKSLRSLELIYETTAGVKLTLELL